MNQKQYYIYIATNKNNTVLYTGVTNNLVRRIYEHKNKFVSSFTEKYKVNKLVYYEIFDSITEAIKRDCLVVSLLAMTEKLYLSQ